MDWIDNGRMAELNAVGTGGTLFFLCQKRDKMVEEINNKIKSCNCYMYGKCISHFPDNFVETDMRYYEKMRLEIMETVWDLVVFDLEHPNVWKGEL